MSIKDSFKSKIEDIKQQWVETPRGGKIIISVSGLGYISAISIIVVLIVLSCRCEHIYGEWITVSQPSCTEIGLSERYCLKECGNKETKEIPLISHSYGEWKTTKKATCINEGIKESVCSGCGDIQTTSISTISHAYGKWTTTQEPTCVEEGSKEKSCVTCADKITESIAVIAHSYGEWIITENAKCTESGLKKAICSTCHKEITDVISATGHTDGEWIVDSAATCTENGSKHQVCAVCSETVKNESISATGHTDGEWIVDSAATCTENGSKHQVCVTCNYTLRAENIIAYGHSYNTEVTKATSTTKVKVLFLCNICQHSHLEEFDPITVSAKLTGSGFIISTGTYYTRSFDVTAIGGYGNYKYKFEAGSNLLRDYSSSNEITVQGNAFIDLATITITVMDEAGQKTVYMIKGDGSYVDSYVIYE